MRVRKRKRKRTPTCQHRVVARQGRARRTHRDTLALGRVVAPLPGSLSGFGVLTAPVLASAGTKTDADFLELSSEFASASLAGTAAASPTRFASDVGSASEFANVWTLAAAHGPQPVLSLVRELGVAIRAWIRKWSRRLYLQIESEVGRIFEAEFVAERWMEAGAEHWMEADPGLGVEGEILTCQGELLQE